MLRSTDSIRTYKNDPMLPTFASLVVAAAVFFNASISSAQTLKVHFLFDDAPGSTTTSSDTSGGGVAVTLTMFNGAGVATDYHGAVASGVSKVNRALDFSSAPSQPPQSGTLNTPVAQVTGSAELGFGTVSTFTAAQWVKLDSVITGGLAPRLFNLGPGSPADVGAANSIGVKFNSATVLRYQIGSSFADATFASGFATNQWYFFAATYDGTDLLIYAGTETSPATLVASKNMPGLSAALGSSAYLSIGNRGNDRIRGLDGWTDDFRFYTGAANAAFIEGIRQSHAPILINNIYPNGTNLFQMTSTLSFSANSPNGISPGGIQVILNGVNVSGGLVVGGTSTARTVSYPGLEANNIYSGSITVTDNAGYIASAVVGRFDTFNPANYVWEAEDYDHSGGLFIDNPQTNAYFGLAGFADIDFVDTNPNAVNPYRGDAMSTGLANDFVRDAYNGTSMSDYSLGFFSTGSAANYRRTYPAGLYNIYARVANGNAGAASGVLSLITNGWGTTTQSGENLGTVSTPATGGWSTYAWVPLRDTAGNLVKFSPGGVSTLRLTSAGDVNYNFFMLAPANTNLPALSGIFPNGTVQFQPTNKLVFTASSAAGINSNSIQVALSVTSLTMNLTTNLSRTNGLVLTGSSASWDVSYSGLVTNAAYVATITVVDQNNNTASTTVRFDTYAPVLTWEAEDFDYSGGQFINTPQTNAYAGFAGISGVDFLNIANGGETFLYRPSGGAVATELSGDSPRRPYVGSGLSDYNVGWFGTGEWVNYTRNLPSGSYNLFVRAANGSGGAGGVSLSQVTAGAGTENQTLANLGAATIPATGGWQTYGWFPFRDGAGNILQIAGGSLATLRITSAGGGQNLNYFMLLPANTNLPTITQIYPNGTSLFQSTNKFAFTASSPAGISSNSIVVTLNGVTLTNLVVNGSSTSWNVSYNGLQPNASYTAVVTVTDANNNSTSSNVAFDTFSPGYYTWEAEDYDYGDGFSYGGLFIDNPQTNAYYSLFGTPEIDFHESYATTPQTRYRLVDTMGTGISGDFLRPQYVGTNDFHLGWFTTGEWVNYTRTFPGGTYYVYGRMARGTAGVGTCTLSQVIDGWGTTSQTVNELGSFAVNPTGGWQNYQWVPLRDVGNNLIVLSLGGTNTFRLTSNGEANVNFFMLVPAVTSAPNVSGTLSGGMVNISFLSGSGVSYQVQYKNDLTDANWTNLGSPIVGDGTNKSVNDAASGAKRFYRLLVQ